MPRCLRVLIVDDEPPARRRLARLLAEIADVEVAGEAGDGHEALAACVELEPDVLLLDIRMPGLDGMSLARQHAQLPPIIFTTAYDNHAIEAFEAAAVDYLLKPVREGRLRQALERVRERDKARRDDRLWGLLERLGERQSGSWRILARAGKTLQVFDARQISRFYALDKLTAFRLDGREYLCDESLVLLERRLSPYGFLRVHRAELINVNCIVSVDTSDGLREVELSDGQRARVSRRLAANLLQALAPT